MNKDSGAGCMADAPNQFALAFIQSTQMDEMHDYLQRGRLFQSNTVDELHEAYPEAYRSFVKAYVVGVPNSKVADDIAAELRLRGLDVPVDSVLDEVAELEKLVRARLPETMPALEEKLDDFLADMVRPN
jgi:hypothetical protein